MTSPSPRLAAIVSSGLVLPLLLLELMLAPGGRLPWVLFAVLWLVPFAAVMLWSPGRGTARRLAGAGTALLLAVFWVALVADQMPCFLGVPNCD